VAGEINFPQHIWDDESLEEKFRWLTGRVLDEERIDRTLALVWQFDAVADVRELTALLAG
jgi:hypothetical protein